MEGQDGYTLARAADASTVERVDALAYRAELALTLQDPDRATELLAELEGIALSPRDRERLAATLTAVSELRRDGSAEGI